jgi:predicted CoA-binding protein
MVTDDAELKRILQGTKVIASVGVSGSAERPSHWIFYYLRRQGYEMYPVNPTAEQVQGLKAYPNLSALPRAVDVVQVFRRPEDVMPVVEEAIRVGAKLVWMQKGIVNHEAAARAEAAGLQVVMDRCMMETHERLLGGIFSFDP